MPGYKTSNKANTSNNISKANETESGSLSASPAPGNKSARKASVPSKQEINQTVSEASLKNIDKSQSSQKKSTNQKQKTRENLVIQPESNNYLSVIQETGCTNLDTGSAVTRNSESVDKLAKVNSNARDNKNSNLKVYPVLPSKEIIELELAELNKDYALSDSFYEPATYYDAPSLRSMKNIATLPSIEESVKGRHRNERNGGIISPGDSWHMSEFQPYCPKKVTSSMLNQFRSSNFLSLSKGNDDNLDTFTFPKLDKCDLNSSGEASDTLKPSIASLSVSKNITYPKRSFPQFYFPQDLEADKTTVPSYSEFINNSPRIRFKSVSDCTPRCRMTQDRIVAEIQQPPRKTISLTSWKPRDNATRKLDAFNRRSITFKTPRRQQECISCSDNREKFLPKGNSKDDEFSVSKPSSFRLFESSHDDNISQNYPQHSDTLSFKLRNSLSTNARLMKKHLIDESTVPYTSEELISRLKSKKDEVTSNLEDLIQRSDELRRESLIKSLTHESMKQMNSEKRLRNLETDVFTIFSKRRVTDSVPLSSESYLHKFGGSVSLPIINGRKGRSTVPRLSYNSKQKKNCGQCGWSEPIQGPEIRTIIKNPNMRRHSHEIRRQFSSRGDNLIQQPPNSFQSRTSYDLSNISATEILSNTRSIEHAKARSNTKSSLLPMHTSSDQTLKPPSLIFDNPTLNNVKISKPSERCFQPKPKKPLLQKFIAQNVDISNLPVHESSYHEYDLWKIDATKLLKTNIEDKPFRKATRKRYTPLYNINFRNPDPKARRCYKNQRKIHSQNQYSKKPLETYDDTSALKYKLNFDNLCDYRDYYDRSKRSTHDPIVSRVCTPLYISDPEQCVSISSPNTQCCTTIRTDIWHHHHDNNNILTIPESQCRVCY